MVIRELRVSGYRSVRELRLQLGNVNVLTGPNGCGKSNLYNSVFLLAKVANGDFARVVAEEGGMASLFRKGREMDGARNGGILHLFPSEKGAGYGACLLLFVSPQNGKNCTKLDIYRMASQAIQ